MIVRFFDSSIDKFIRSLEKETVAKVLRTVDLLEIFGNNLSLPHSRKIASGLFELRVRGRQEVRLFYTFCKGDAVLLGGFIKKTQRTPQREIDSALKKIARLT
mgnify:CR=1 FL=1